MKRIPKSELISIENGAKPQFDEGGNVIVQTATCGVCGRSWNDALITGVTPVPSGRCPYEAYHPEPLPLPSAVAQAREKARRGAATMADIDALIAEYQTKGKSAAMALFDAIAKRRKLKSFEAHMLIIGFQRECANRGISLIQSKANSC
jgi:hypothetical protein